MSLDIAFSDHRISTDTITAFGEVIQAIHRVCPDDKLRFWSFIYYVATNHPTVLGVNLPEEQQEKCAGVLANAHCPDVIVEESEAAKFMRETGNPAE